MGSGNGDQGSVVRLILKSIILRYLLICFLLPVPIAIVVTLVMVPCVCPAKGGGRTRHRSEQYWAILFSRRNRRNNAESTEVRYSSASFCGKIKLLADSAAITQSENPSAFSAGNKNQDSG